MTNYLKIIKRSARLAVSMKNDDLNKKWRERHILSLFVQALKHEYRDATIYRKKLIEKRLLEC
jgi:hypothetical protein